MWGILKQIMGDFVLGGFGLLGGYLRWDFILGDLVRERKKIEKQEIALDLLFFKLVGLEVYQH